MRPQQPAPIDPNRQLMIVLPAFGWNTVVAALRKLPYEVVCDIIGDMQQQFTQQAIPQSPPDPPPEPDPPPAPAPEPAQPEQVNG